MLKTYTGTLAKLIEEHLMENNIIFPEQAGATKGLWGCTDQLLINLVVTDEVKKGRKNLCMIWLDYKKAYDLCHMHGYWKHYAWRRYQNR